MKPLAAVLTVPALLILATRADAGEPAQGHLFVHAVVIDPCFVRAGAGADVPRVDCAKARRPAVRYLTAKPEAAAPMAVVRAAPTRGKTRPSIVEVVF